MMKMKTTTKVVLVQPENDLGKILQKKYYANEEIKKLSLLKKINSAPIFDLNDFNPLLYDFDFESKKNQIYRVDNTDYLINILPRKYK